MFSNDDLSFEGLDHVRPLFIDVACLGHRVPFVLLDNVSALNVCLLVTAIVLDFHRLILSLLHKLSELIMGLRGKLWAHSIHMS